MLVSESGIRTAEDSRRLRACGADAILVGEALMRSGDVARQAAALKLMRLRRERAPRSIERGLSHNPMTVVVTSRNRPLARTSARNASTTGVSTSR